MAECRSLVELSKARKALAAASSFDDVLAIRDQAEAARAYAKAAQLSLEAANEATAVKLLAERKAGEMLYTAGHSRIPGASAKQQGRRFATFGSRS